MNLAANPDLWLLIPALPIALWAMHTDVSRMIIPNRAVLALAASFLVVGALALPFGDYLARIGIGAATLVAGFLLAQIRGLGAGDAKFMAAMAPFVAGPGWPDFLLVMVATMVGGFVLHRVARMTPLRAATGHWESWDRRDFPMGLALGAGLVIHLAMGAAA